MFQNQFLAVKNMPRKTRESFFMLLPTCVSHVIPMQVDCTHRVRFLCIVRILCDSRECDLYDSSVFLLHQGSFA